MKKVLSALIVMLLVAGACFLSFAEVDYSGMTDEELLLHFDHIRAEMLKRKAANEGNQEKWEENGFSFCILGEPEWSEGNGGMITIPVLMINNTDLELHIEAQDEYINGWRIGASGAVGLDPGTKAKTELTFYFVKEKTDLTGIEDLSDIKMKIVALHWNDGWEHQFSFDLNLIY